MAGIAEGKVRMKVLYDDAAFNQPHGGVTKYFSELISNLPPDVEHDISVRTTQCQYLWDEPFSFPRATHTFWNFWPWLKVRGKSYIYKFLAKTLRAIPSSEYENRRLFVKKLKHGDFDVLHITDPHKYTFEWERIVGKKPVVMTVHDLIPDMEHRNVLIRRNRAKALRLVNHVIAVSEHTKNDIIKLYGIPPDKITVVYHGHDSFRAGVKEIFQRMKYLLYVGGRRGYKNFAFFRDAIIPLMNDIQDLHLVCTGGKLSAEEMKPFVVAGVGDRVHSRFVETEEFPSLFSHAVCFVYPSKYEGFGIPIVDAFACECPVVLSRCSCFPEIGGDAALYFEDGDGEMLREHVRRLMDDSTLRAEMIARGKARSELFSWKKCAEETVQVYFKVLGGR